MSEVEKGYIGPLEWFSVPGGRVYCIGHEKAVAMCFAPDDEGEFSAYERIEELEQEVDKHANALIIGWDSWQEQMSKVRDRAEKAESERDEALAALAKIAATDMSVPGAEWPQHYFQRRLYEAKEIAGWEPKGGEDD